MESLTYRYILISENAIAPTPFRHQDLHILILKAPIEHPMRFKHSATLPAPKLQMLAQSSPQNVYSFITAMPCLQCLFRCSLLSFAMTQSNSGQGSVPVTYTCTLQCITGGRQVRNSRQKLEEEDTVGQTLHAAHC